MQNAGNLTLGVHYAGLVWATSSLLLSAIEREPRMFWEVDVQQIGALRNLQILSWLDVAIEFQITKLQLRKLFKVPPAGFIQITGYGHWNVVKSNIFTKRQHLREELYSLSRVWVVICNHTGNILSASYRTIFLKK